METLDSLGLTLIITSHEMDFLSRMAGVFYTFKRPHQASPGASHPTPTPTSTCGRSTRTGTKTSILSTPGFFSVSPPRGIGDNVHDDGHRINEEEDADLRLHGLARDHPDGCTEEVEVLPDEEDQGDALERGTRRDTPRPGGRRC